MQILADMVGRKQYDDATKLAKKLSQKCSRSPMLNFIQGKILEFTDNREQALFFYQKASEYTYEFAVTPDTSKRIWYSRYEFEFPERTAESIQKMADEKVALQEALAAANQGIADGETKYALREEAFKDKLRSDYRVGMWTGVGIGIAGVAMTAAGLGLIASLSDEDKYEKGEPGEAYRISPMYTTGWTLLGLGIAAAVSGTIVSGIFGYKLSHVEEDRTFALQISPINASFTMTF